MAVDMAGFTLASCSSTSSVNSRSRSPRPALVDVHDGAVAGPPCRDAARHATNHGFSGAGSCRPATTPPGRTPTYPRSASRAANPPRTTIPKIIAAAGWQARRPPWPACEHAAADTRAAALAARCSPISAHRQETLPGVRSASTVNTRPFLGSFLGPDVKVPGYVPPEAIEGGDLLTYRVVSSLYFETLRAELVQGRAFSTGDGPDGAAVAVVNEAAAARYSPDVEPIGWQFRPRFQSAAAS